MAGGLLLPPVQVLAMKALVAILALSGCLAVGLVNAWGMVRYWAAEARRAARRDDE